MSNTGAGRAWRFLKRNPDYAAEWEAAADTVPPAEPAPFPVRTQSPADRAAAAWGLMAWEDPLAEEGSPFWTDAPALRGIPVPGAPPLTALLAGPGVRLSGLRLADGARWSRWSRARLPCRSGSLTPRSSIRRAGS